MTLERSQLSSFALTLGFVPPLYAKNFIVIPQVHSTVTFKTVAAHFHTFCFTKQKIRVEQCNKKEHARIALMTEDIQVAAPLRKIFAT